MPVFVKGLWEATRLTAARRFELEEVPTGMLRADPDRLAQALRNLLGNAIAHTAPDNGRIRLTVRRRGKRVNASQRDLHFKTMPAAACRDRRA